jgi:SAM-dependent MidA family methyltransferase
MAETESASVSTALERLVRRAIAEGGGWLPFDRYMALALYAPTLGYYTRGAPVFGTLPESGSDFVTAPELSPFFGRALANQVAQALVACGVDEVWEFGAGSGALAESLLEALVALGTPVRRYTIVDVSGALRGRQAARLERFGAQVAWADAWPEAIDGVVVGNEVLDAMPVHLLHFDGLRWLERGVTATEEGLAFADRPTDLRPPLAAGLPDGTTTEVHLQAEAFVRDLARRLRRGVAFMVDYGFPEAEYYHPQRSGGTLMCHRAHRADTDPLAEVGTKDITAHLDFTRLALAAQDEGCAVIGYTSQAHFLVNCGILPLLEGQGLAATANAHKLLAEHEMGELFKVLAFARGCAFEPMGFVHGDRRHRL